MRIAIFNWTGRLAGGVEGYLDVVARGLLEEGHQIALVSETDYPSGRDLIADGTAVERFDLDLSSVEILDRLRGWGPDIVFCNRINNPLIEVEATSIAPSVLFVHDYNGLCISGTRTLMSPQPTACNRTLGLGCLLNYYPRRCGGLSPLTMVHDYKKQHERLQVMRSYRTVLTNSDYLRRELLRHGISATRIYPPVDRPLENLQMRQHGPWRLLFLARMDRLKGGQMLIDALPKVAQELGENVRAAFAGDGPARQSLESAASRIAAAHNNLEIRFVGWLNEEQKRETFRDTDLLVMPSVWPEPFGLAGIEAGLQGVPAAAFPRGGIPEWLSDGVNGYLAPEGAASAASLAGAIIKCLIDPARYEQLRSGARSVALRFNGHDHIQGLLSIFEEMSGLHPFGEMAATLSTGKG